MSPCLKLLLLVILAGAALPAAALAAPPASQGQPEADHGNSADHGNAGGQSDSGNAAGRGQGQGNAGSNGNGAGSKPTNQGRGPADGIVVPDQDEAIAAVRSGAAMPLADLLGKIGLEGSVVDAKLISMRGFLVYQIKVLSPDKSNLETYYYYARSGIRVGGN